MGRNISSDEADHERKAAVYDRFADYVRDKMRSRHNPNLSVREFALMGPSGVTHLDLRLENVKNAKKKLYDLVEQFDSRAFLDTQEDIQTGNLIYVAHVPFKSEEKRSHRSHQSRSSGSGPPSTGILMAYIMMLMLLMIVGVWKTTWGEWAFMFQ